MTLDPETVKDKRISVLVERIYDKYGVDFQDYAPASFKRRINAVLHAEGLDSIEILEKRILEDPLAYQRFIHEVTVSVTSMFRDPTFYLTLRKHVIPVLATYPFVRLWLAGCSSGEEVYSIAITLFEEGLYDRVRIYATDLDSVSVQQAKLGIYPLSAMKGYSTDYLNAGGRDSLSQYFTADRENALFRNYLKKQIVFAQHNLVGDGSFNEFHMVLCRNVLIYFNSKLRERVLALLHGSLVKFGFLCLGSKESLRFSEIDACYEQVSDREKIYKRVL